MVKSRLAPFFILAFVGGFSLNAVKTSDGPNEWSSLGLEGQVVLGLAVDPSSDGTLYAGTFGAGLFKTTDGGLSWSRLTNGLPTGDRPEARALAIDPSSPSTVYVSAGLRAITGIASSYGLYKSGDAGASWTRLPLPTRDGQGFVQELVIDPTSPSVLYATTIEGVFKSTDAGTSWIKVLTNGLAIAIDSHPPSTVYVGAAELGVLQSTDGGSTWGSTGDGLSDSGTTVFSVAIDPLSPGVLYAAVFPDAIYRRAAAGSNWTLVNNGTLIDTLAIAPLRVSTVYAGSPAPFNGVLRSVDGMNWTPFSDGLTGYGYDIYLLKVDPRDAAVLYAATGNGVFRLVSRAIENLGVRKTVFVPFRQ